jgi:hypothetical protein
MYNMGLCFYHHAAFLRRLHAEQPPQHEGTAADEIRRDVAQLLARSGAQFAELRASGRMGHVSGNVLYRLACVHALVNDEHQCQVPNRLSYRPRALRGACSQRPHAP